MGWFSSRKKKGSEAGGKNMLDQLHDATVDGLQKNIADEQARSGWTPERLWNSPASHSDKLIAELDKAVMTAASNGRPQLSARFSHHIEDKFLLGLELNDDDAAAGSCRIIMWNFDIIQSNGTKALAYKTDGHIAQFQNLVVDKIEEHFRTQGLECSDSDPDRKGDPLCKVTIKWMAAEEHKKIRDTLQLPGGYEAYKAGVPLDDILA